MKTLTLNPEKRGRATVIMILLAISTISFSQDLNSGADWLSNLKERFLAKSKPAGLISTVSYYETFESKCSPTISRTIHSGSAEVIYESIMPVEVWMKTPFETSTEESLRVEEWMTVPFEIKEESGVELEHWMSTPQAWLN